MSIAPAHQFADLEQQEETRVLGMWVFLATEVMIFGGLFTGYAVYRSDYPAEFAAGSNALSLSFAAANTVVLLTSSLTMALAVHAVQIARGRRALIYLFLTTLLGTAFLVIKGFEYHHDYLDRLVPGLAFVDDDWSKPQKVKLFLLFYYFMTGLHAVHLIVGIGLVLVMTGLIARGRVSPESHGSLEAVGLYWHLVDVIWIFLLPLLYMSGVRTG